MACTPEILRNVALFALLDDEELAVLAGQVELKRFASRERIYKIGDRSGPAYVLLSGKVRVTTVDEDYQEVVIDEPPPGEFFGFASMIDQTPHRPERLPSKRRSVSRSNGATLPFSCNASPSRESI